MKQSELALPTVICFPVCVSVVVSGLDLSKTDECPGSSGHRKAALSEFHSFFVMLRPSPVTFALPMDSHKISVILAVWLLVCTN